MIKQRYDFAFSLGESCTCSEVLRRLDMQFGSYPFDWGGCGNAVKHARLMGDDFRDLMPIEALEFLGSDLNEGVDKYVNRNNRFHFIHDFPTGVPLDDTGGLRK